MARMTGFVFHEAEFRSQFGVGVVGGNQAVRGGVPLTTRVERQALVKAAKETARRLCPRTEFNTPGKKHLQDTIFADFDTATNVLRVYATAPHAAAIEYGMTDRIWVTPKKVGPSPPGRKFNPLIGSIGKGTVVQIGPREPHSYLWRALELMFPNANIPGEPRQPPVGSF